MHCVRANTHLVPSLVLIGFADGEHILLSDGSGGGTSVVQLGCPFNKIENEVIVYTLQLRLHKQSDCGLTCLSCDTVT
jgi:hypothetical protein